MGLGDRPEDAVAVWLILALVCVIAWAVLGIEVVRFMRWAGVV